MFTPGKKSIFYANPEFNQTPGHEEDEGASESDDEDSRTSSQGPKSTDINQGPKDVNKNSLSEMSIPITDDIISGKNVGAVTEFASSCDRQNLDRNEIEHVCKLANQNRSSVCCNGRELCYRCKSSVDDSEELHDLQIFSLSNHENDHVNLDSINVVNMSLCDKCDNEL